MEGGDSKCQTDSEIAVTVNIVKAVSAGMSRVKTLGIVPKLVLLSFARILKWMRN
jgi:hypothetical protein